MTGDASTRCELDTRHRRVHAADVSTDEEPVESMDLTPRVPAAVGARSAAHWVLRSVATAALLVVAVWWNARRPVWATRTACGPAHEHLCDEAGLAFETYAPAVLWGITVVATFLVTGLGILTGPPGLRERSVWGMMLCVSIFVANSGNPLWAIAVTGVALWAIASTGVTARRSVD